MCLTDRAQVLHVHEDGTAVVRGARGDAVVSLAPLVLDGVTVAAGDTVIVALGLAVDLATDPAPEEQR